MIYQIDKQILLEHTMLIQEEMSQMAKRGMALGGTGVGLAMGHAGAFGGGIKHAIDSGAEMGANMGGRAAAVAGNTMNQTKDFYAPKAAPGHAPGPAEHATHAAESAAAHAAHDASVPAHDIDIDDDDDSGMGVLSGIGAATVAAGAGYLGLKGGKAANNAYQGSNFQKNNQQRSDNTKKSYAAGKAGMHQAGGFNVANKLGGIRRALGNK